MARLDSGYVDRFLISLQIDAEPALSAKLLAGARIGIDSNQYQDRLPRTVLTLYMTRAMHTANVRYLPRPPFLGWPRQVQFDGGYGWLTPQGPAIVTQTSTACASHSTVHSLCDLLDELVQARVTACLPGLVVLHDWRSLTSVEEGARAIWAHRTRRSDNPFAATDIYVALGGSSVLRMALRTAALTIQLTNGQRAARFIEKPEQVIGERGVGPPPADFWARWRRTPCRSPGKAD